MTVNGKENKIDTAFTIFYLNHCVMAKYEFTKSDLYNAAIKYGLRNATEKAATQSIHDLRRHCEENGTKIIESMGRGKFIKIKDFEISYLKFKGPAIYTSNPAPNVINPNICNTVEYPLKPEVTNNNVIIDQIFVNPDAVDQLNTPTSNNIITLTNEQLYAVGIILFRLNYIEDVEFEIGEVEDWIINEGNYTNKDINIILKYMETSGLITKIRDGIYSRKKFSFEDSLEESVKNNISDQGCGIPTALYDECGKRLSRLIEMNGLQLQEYKALKSLFDGTKKIQELINPTMLEFIRKTTAEMEDAMKLATSLGFVDKDTLTLSSLKEGDSYYAAKRIK